jgi:hypothetical protein
MKSRLFLEDGKWYIYADAKCVKRKGPFHDEERAREFAISIYGSDEFAPAQPTLTATPIHPAPPTLTPTSYFHKDEVEDEADWDDEDE